MSRPWMFDMDILCPMCGGHRMKFSSMVCPKFQETLNKKYFIILKFMELEYRIKELENDKPKNDDETVERGRGESVG